MPREYITANKAYNLYWLGRHLKRIEIEMAAIDETFNQLIDQDKEAGRKLFQKLGVNLHYQNASEFIQECIYGDHPYNLYQTMQNTRENCIIVRNYLPQDVFAAIIELYQLFKQNKNNLHDIDYHFIDTALMIILRIWGSMHQCLEHKRCYDFLRMGRLVEKTDLRLRLDAEIELALLLIDDIDVIASGLNSSYEKESLRYFKIPTILEKINQKIAGVITDKI